MESGVEEKSGGDSSVENSKKQRSLDLQTLYKSADLCKIKFSAEETSDTDFRKKKKKKRKSIKDVSLDNPDPPVKKSKSSTDEDHVNGDSSTGPAESRLSSSGLEERLNYNNGLSGFSLSLDSNGNAIQIPKRPRGSVGRKKIDSGRGSQLSLGVRTLVNGNCTIKNGTSVNGNGTFKNEPEKTEGDELPKKSGSYGREARSDEWTSKLPYSAGNDVAVKVKVNGNGTLRNEPEKIEGDKLPKKSDKLPIKSVTSGGEARRDEWTSKLPYSAGNDVAVKVKVKRKINVDESREKKKDRASSSRHAKEDGHVAVNNGESSSRKHHQSSSNKRKASSSRSRKSVKNCIPSGDNFGSFCQDSLDDDDEENLEQNAARMLSSRFDPSCTGFSSKSRSSTSLSADRLTSLLTSGQDFVSREASTLAGSESATVDTANRVLRPRQKFKERGTSRKRRHFYEVLPGDVDVYWVLNRRIKVFWPLDESWYYGLLNDYDPDRKLHHVKYDDRDEEWINLENERFKLLLFPGEVPGKKRRRRSVNVSNNIDGRKLDSTADDDSHQGNFLDSEPIISWLARSSHRAKSSPAGPMKKQKTLSTPVVSSLMHVKTEGTLQNLGSPNSNKDKPDMDVLYSKAKSSLVESYSSPTYRKPVVYVRRRFHKKSKGLATVYEADKAYGADVAAVSVAPILNGVHSDNSSIICIPRSESENIVPAVDNKGLHMPLLEAKQFRIEICLPALRFLLLEAEQTWLSRTVLLLQHGAIMIRWPKITLEMLFVDNVVGLRFLLFECWLNHAVVFISLVLKLFNQADEEWRFESLELPVTSVRFRLCSILDSRKQQSFTFYCFSKLKNSKWLYLDSKLQKHSLLAKELPLSECTYENIKSLDCRNEPLQFNAHAEPSSFKKELAPSVMSSAECCSARLTHSTISSAMKLGRIPPIALSFAAAPTFFICLHLRLLMERNFACVALQDYDSIDGSQSVRDDKCSENIAETTLTGVSSARGSSFSELQLGCSACEQLGTEPVSLKSSQNCQLDIARSTAKHSKLDTSGVIVVSKKLESGDQELDQFVASPVQRHSSNISHCLSSARCQYGLVGMSVVIPSFDQVEGGLCNGKGVISREVSPLTLNAGDDVISSRSVTSKASQSPNNGTSDHMVESPNYCGPRGLLYHNRNSSSSSPPVWVDRKTNFTRSGFGVGPKRPRTQVQYTLPYRGYDFGSIHKNHSPRTLPYRRIRRSSEKKNVDSCSGSQRNIELIVCHANVLVTEWMVKGWREYGAQIVLEIAGHNEWKIAVKFSGITKYSYKVHGVLQPGSTNRFTHAMMWKGGKDWVLEFPDRSQWMLFKEMHEECYNRNIRAASVKNIPIPGVCLIEEIEDYASEVSFIRCSPKYYRQVESDVEMAMNPLRVLYDMDSEDEQWLSNNESKCDEISEELFEKTMDMLEKFAYARQHDHFTPDELEELMVGVGSTRAVKSIYEHWQNKRQKKGMALIRHLQVPLWERYQQQLKEWEAMSNASFGFSQENAAASMEKPAMSAFCLKPRGLEVPNKGSKQRSQRKISLSGHSHRDHDALHSSGRRLNGHAAHGDEMVVYQSHEYSDGSPMLHASPRVFLPGEGSGFGYFSLNSDMSDWNHQPKFYRNKPKKMGAPQSNQQMLASYDERSILKRNGLHRSIPEWPSYHPEGSRGLAIEQFDVHELRLRDASGAAQHALNNAKLKREKAQRLLNKADLAIHKAVVALMTAEAIKAAAQSTNIDGH